MHMGTPNNDINWDKLLPKLDGESEQVPLNGSEEEVVQVSEAIQQHLLEAAEEAREFPVAEGWETFQSALPEAERFELEPVRKPKRGLYIWLSIAAAVAALLMFSGIRFMLSRHAAPVITQANMPPSSQVRLSLSNGKNVLLQTGEQVLEDADGSTIHASNDVIIYQPSTVENSIVNTNILEVPRGRQAKLVLADGTKVWVNADSRLEYPTAFNGSRREVVVSGEAYFEVAVNEKQPFVVKAKEMEVTVLGTAFNVNTYDHTIQTTLVSGKVSAKVGNEKVILLPGEQAAFDKSLIKHKVSVRLSTAWKDGEIYFEGADLKEIVHSLEREYDYTIYFEDANLEQLHFTLEMPKTGDLQDVLDRIANTTGKVKFKTENRKIIVSKP
jgi:transmembrane sensor